VAIGIGLKQVKEASQSVENETFMIESSVIFDDILRVLQTDKDLDLITQAGSLEEKRDALATFLAGSAFIPFESSGIKVILEIKSARDKFNPNTLVDTNQTQIDARVDALGSYFLQNGIENEFLGFILDSMSGIKEDGNYRSELFIREPTLFREYLANTKHFSKVKRVYKDIYHTSSLEKVKFNELFYFSPDRKSAIDLNYTPLEVWKMILGVESDRAQQLVDGEGSYGSLADMLLSDEEKLALAKFKTSFYEPYLDVKVEILKSNKNVKIQLEYDLTTKKGSHFIYELQ
jgi:hypothetical protein